MISEDDAGHQVSYWPSVSDLFMTLFVVAIAMVSVVLFVFVVNPKEDMIEGAVEELGIAMGLEPAIQTVEPGPEHDKAILSIIRKATEAIEACKDLRENSSTLVQCRQQEALLRQELTQIQELLSKAEEALRRIEQDRKQLAAELMVAREQNERSTDWHLVALEFTDRLLAKLDAISGSEPLNDEPPIITIRSDQLFRSGRADIGSDSALRQEFQSIAQQIMRRNANGIATVDTLEIIGHTDSVPIAGRLKGNLDGGLPEYLNGRLPLQSMKPGSNNDLGLLRALAIKEAWESFVDESAVASELSQVSVRTYSAGQTQPRNPEIADDPQSRRIELRLTKLGP